MKKFYVFIAMFIAIFLPLGVACNSSGGSNNSKYYSVSLEFNNLSIFSDDFILNDIDNVIDDKEYSYSVSFDGDNYLYLTSNKSLNENIKDNTQVNLSFYLASYVDTSSINFKVNKIDTDISFDNLEDYLFFDFSFNISSNVTIAVDGYFELLF